MDTKVTILIPNYNGILLLEKNLPSVKAAARRFGGNVQILVVDDGSTDGSAEWLEENCDEVLGTLILDKNMGFAGAVLEGARAADGEILYLLNSDIVVEEDFLDNVIPHFEDEKVFAVSSKAYNGAGDRLIAARSGILWKWGHPDVDREGVHSEVGRSAGPTLFASGGHSAYRRRLFLDMGGFDKLYSPYYFEDVDLGYRAWKLGYEIRFEPTSVVYHDHQSTIGSVASRRRIETVWRRNRLLFTWKNIDDPQLMIRHMLTLPVYVAAGTGGRGISVLLGFVNAVGRLSMIKRRRRADRQRDFQRTDREILDMFSNMF